MAVTRMHGRGARGMTLIEVMVAMLLSTIGLLGMLALLGTTYKSTDNNRRMSEASVIAQTTLERLVALPRTAFAGVTATPAPCPPISAATEARFTGTTTPSAVQYGRTCEMVRCGLLNCMTVTVSWLDQSNGRVRSVQQQRARTP